MQRRLTAFVLLTAVLAACTPPGATTTPKPRRSPAAIRPVPSAGPGTLHGQLPGGGTLISDHGAHVISNNGGTLTGKVKAPASLIANNGGGLVANNGGGLVANNGGGLVAYNGGGVIANNGGAYRLRAVDQLAVAGARVELLDAAGARARDRAGNEVPPATTGADGRYTFTADLPARNLVVRVVLAGTSGELRAIAPPDASARQATDIDLVSTLATGYILDKFVKGQADAQATLDKLPAAVEAETRRATAAALDKGTAPTDLAPATVVAAVDALRKADGALDAQLEKVRALLVAAGLSDLGAGRLATEVGLSWIDHVAVTSDGRVFLACATDKRVWTVDARGRLQVAVGRSPAGADADLEGKAGAEASIDRPQGIAADGDGLLILEPKRLSRLGADGTLHVLATGLVRPRAVVPRADGRHLVIAAPTYIGVKDASGRYAQKETAPGTIGRVTPAGGAPEQLHAFPSDVGAKVASATRVAPGPGGAIWLALPLAFKVAPPLVLALDPTTFQPAEVVRRDAAPQAQIALDDAGRIFTRGGGKSTFQAVVGTGGFAVGESSGMRDFAPIAQAPDGSWVFASGAKAFRTTASEPALLAGLANAPREGLANALSFGSLEALAVEPGGGMMFYDDDSRWIWRADAAGNARVAFDLPEFWPTDDDDFLWPEALHLAPGGVVWFYDIGANDPRAMRLAPDGAITSPFTLAAGEKFEQLAVLPDGTAVILVANVGADGERVLRRLGSDGRLLPDIVVPALGVPEDPEDELGFAIEDSEFQLGVGPDGVLWLAGDYTLRRWTAAGGLATVASGESWELSGGSWYTGGIAIDAMGRLYGIANQSVEQFDPKTRAAKIVAGRDLEGAAGAGVDEGTGQNLSAPCVDGAGNLYFLDTEYRQIKRVPREKL